MEVVVANLFCPSETQWLLYVPFTLLLRSFVFCLWHILVCLVVLSLNNISRLGLLGRNVCFLGFQESDLRFEISSLKTEV